MSNDRPYVTLLLPDGLSPVRYHALADGLVSRLATAPAAPAAGQRRYIVLSELDRAPPEDMPVLNDSTWTLTIPVPAAVDLQAILEAARSLPNGDAVKVELPPRYKADSGDA